MAGPAIIWRNPRFVQPRRLWTQATKDGARTVYLVAEPVSAAENAWQGLPNLEVIRGGAAAKAARVTGRAQSGA